MKVSICIMAHPDRYPQAQKLYAELFRQGFEHVRVQIDTGTGEWINAYKAWSVNDINSDYSIVIQDDAIISDNFYKNVVNAIQNIPSEGMLSFYTGKIKPYPNQVKTAVNKADNSGASYLRSVGLHWGVCVAMPTKHIQTVLNKTQGLQSLYDVRLGEGAIAAGLPIYYTNPSLVDHNDDLPSLTGHKNVEKRVAHRYEPDVVAEWNSNYINIL